MNRFPTPAEIAEEAREALRQSPESPEEHFDRLVRLGFINARGEVTKLLGGDADPEPGTTVSGSDDPSCGSGDLSAAAVRNASSIIERLLVAPDDEDRMRSLMEKNNQGTICADEQAEMQAFRQVGSFLAIAQAKARMQLNQAGDNQPGGSPASSTRARTAN